MTRHQLRISAFVSQTSVWRENSGGITKCQQFSQATTVQGLQILLISGVTVTSASQILESFWNSWSQVSQQKKPFSDFQARGPCMYTLS